MPSAAQVRGYRAGAPGGADRHSGRIVDAGVGMVAVAELVERHDLIERLDTRIGPIKTRARGHTGGQLLVGLAAAQLAREDFGGAGSPPR